MTSLWSSLDLFHFSSSISSAVCICALFPIIRISTSHVIFFSFFHFSFVSEFKFLLSALLLMIFPGSSDGLPSLIRVLHWQLLCFSQSFTFLRGFSFVFTVRIFFSYLHDASSRFCKFHFFLFSSCSKSACMCLRRSLVSASLRGILAPQEGQSNIGGSRCHTKK